MNVERIAVTTSATLETATGIALIATPNFVIQLLIGAQSSGAGIAVGRVCGFALLSPGLATWPRQDGTTAWATVSPFAYNLLVSLYPGYLGGSGEFSGLLLWPACIVHCLLMLLLASPTHRVLRST